MRVAVVGGGMLGLTLAHRLSAQGQRVTLFEAAPELGGLAGAHDYGEFVWDRFYHCVLPQDERLIALLAELGLADELRWRSTGTGYWAGGTHYSMSGNRDFYRFPLLSLFDKARLGAAIVWATRFARPEDLYSISAADWLRRICGDKNYRVFWKPLLQAKLGPYHDRVAAVFIWATLKRLFGARRGLANREKLGYVRGGYARIIDALRSSIVENGGSVHVRCPVTAIRREVVSNGVGGETVLCAIDTPEATGRMFDQVFFTGPARLARGIVSPDLTPHVDDMERRYPAAKAYLGVLCGVLALESPMTPYYVLNIADDGTELTGLIEMTNLVDPQAETGGRSLVYLPRYVPGDDASLDATDDELWPSFLDRGVERLFPGFRRESIRYRGIHRAKWVQPLPLAGEDCASYEDRAPEVELPPIHRPFQILSTFMLRAATLNNDEVVGLVDRYLAHIGPPSTRERRGAEVSTVGVGRVT